LPNKKATVSGGFLSSTALSDSAETGWG